MTDQEIKPRWEGHKPWCDEKCPSVGGIQTHAGDIHSITCSHGYYVTSHPGGMCSPRQTEVCVPFVQRMAAWAEEARSAIAEPNGILGSGFLPLDWRDDLDDLLSRYPGKQPTSRQTTKDGE